MCQRLYYASAMHRENIMPFVRAATARDQPGRRDWSDLSRTFNDRAAASPGFSATDAATASGFALYRYPERGWGAELATNQRAKLERPPPRIPIWGQCSITGTPFPFLSRMVIGPRL